MPSEELRYILTAQDRTEREVKKTEKGIERVDQKTQRLNKNIGGLKTALGGLAAGAGFAELAGHVNQTTTEIREQRLETQKLLDVNESTLSKVQTKARALTQVYGDEYSKVLQSANALSKRFEITQLEALEKIEEGYAKGGSQAEDYLKQIREYNAELEQAGQSADRFVGTITMGAKEGVFDDKLPDAVREFTKSIEEQTQPVQDAMQNAFGKEFADRIKTQMEEGKMDAMGALDAISRKLNEVEPNIQEKRQLLEDLFKGPGEAIGPSLIDNLDKITKSLDEQGGEFSELEKHQQHMVDQYEELSAAQQRFERQSMKFGNNFKELWVDIKTSAWNALNAINKGITEVTGSFDERVSAGTTERLNEKQELRSETKQERFEQFKGGDPFNIAASMGIDIDKNETVKEAFRDHIKKLKSKRNNILDKIEKQEFLKEASEPTGGYGLALEESINAFLPEGHKVGDPFGLGPDDSIKDDKKAKKAQKLGGEIDALRKFVKQMKLDKGGPGGGGGTGDPGGKPDPDPEPDPEPEPDADQTPTENIGPKKQVNYQIEIHEVGNDMKVVAGGHEMAAEEVQEHYLNALLTAVTNLQKAGVNR